MKPSVAFLPAGIDACALYRMFFAHLKLAGSVWMFQPQRLAVDILKDRNIVIVQRLSTQQNYEAMKIFKNMRLKIVYDLDDDLWAVPTYNPAYAIIKKWLPGFEICAQMADVITVSTEHLRVMVRQALGKKCPPVEVVENAVDFGWFRPLEEKYRKKREGKVVLGWAGTDTHSEDVKPVFALIPELLRECPELEFEVAGQKLSDELLSFGDRVRQKSFVPIAEFAAYWSSWQWDVSLAPVARNSFNLSKSNIKMLEAATLKIPCVASRFGEYKKFAYGSRILQEGIMAETLKEWRNKLYALVKSKELRKVVGEEMYQQGKKRYDIQLRVATWNAIFESLL